MKAREKEQSPKNVSFQHGQNASNHEEGDEKHKSVEKQSVPLWNNATEHEKPDGQPSDSIQILFRAGAGRLTSFYHNGTGPGCPDGRATNNSDRVWRYGRFHPGKVRTHSRQSSKFPLNR